jgi:N-acetyl-beta-hexosaminidase
MIAQGRGSRESYELRVSLARAEILARSSAGLCYAIQTVRQLVEERAGENFLPEVEIRDWPSLPYRGFMMDTSHGPLPTEDEIKRQIGFYGIELIESSRTEQGARIAPGSSPVVDSDTNRTG